VTSAPILVVATLDTKGREAAFLCDRIEARGVEWVLIDAGILGESSVAVPHVSRHEVALASGRQLDHVRASGGRGPAVEHMMRGLQRLVPGLNTKHEFAGAVGIGGAEGALLAASAFRMLPFGIPKLVVTPIACGVRRFGPFVGNADIALLHSVADLQGLNAFTARILDTAAGMATTRAAPFEWPEPKAGRVAMSLNGNTTAVGSQIQQALTEHGHEVVAFHANGVGGVNMEELAVAGHFIGLIDLTTNELVEEVIGGLFPVIDRLRIAGRTSVPRVVVPGCLDFVCQGGPDEVEPRFSARAVDAHNPNITLVQVSQDEAEKIADAFVRRLADSDGPLRVVVPTGGLSLGGSPGGSFCGTEADGAVLASLVAIAEQTLPLTFVDAAINDTSVADAVLVAFEAVLDAGAVSASPQAAF
jgi:uncharacterized protein (UPF0261 family)